MQENLVISFKVDPELARVLRVAAAVRGLNRSEFIRVTLREKIREKPIQVKLGEHQLEPANV